MQVLRSDDVPINSVLKYINEVNHVPAKQNNGVYITKKFLDDWDSQNSLYTLERGEVVTTKNLNEYAPRQHGYSTSNDPIDKIYMKKNGNKIATFNYNGTNFYLETEGGSNKKTKNTKSKRITKRRTKRSKKSKRGSKKSKRKIPVNIE